MIVSKPESGASEFIELLRETLDQTPLFGKAIDAGSADHIDAEFAGNRDGVTIVHEQGFRLEFLRQSQSFTLSRMKPNFAEFRGSGIVTQTPYAYPCPLSSDDVAGNRELRALDGDLLENCRWNRDLSEELTEQLEIIQGGEIDKGTAVRDNQSRLPVSATSFKFFNGLAVRVPVVDRVDYVWNAPLFKQFHELKPAHPKIARGLTSRDLAVGKKSQDRFLAQSLLKLVLVDRAFGDVDFDFKLHGGGPTVHSTAVDKN